MSKVTCTRCGKEIKGEHIMLELSNTNGHYYHNSIPYGHVSQGAFPFGVKCAAYEIIDTYRFIDNEVNKLRGIK